MKSFLITTILFSCFAGAFASNISLKESVQDVDFRDSKDKKLSVAVDKPTVFILWSMRCPCAKRYSKPLNQLYHEFEPRGLQMIAVNPFKEETIEEIESNSKLWKVSFPIVKDLEGKFANKFQLRATPEVFLFNSSGKLVYQGAIDDALYFMKKPKQRYLYDAVQSLFQGKPLAFSSKEPWGCSYYRSQDQ